MSCMLQHVIVITSHASVVTYNNIKELRLYFKALYKLMQDEEVEVLFLGWWGPQGQNIPKNLVKNKDIVINYSSYEETLVEKEKIFIMIPSCGELCTKELHPATNSIYHFWTAWKSYKAYNNYNYPHVHATKSGDNVTISVHLSVILCDPPTLFRVISSKFDADLPHVLGSPNSISISGHDPLCLESEVKFWQFLWTYFVSLLCGRLVQHYYDFWP